MSLSAPLFDAPIAPSLDASMPDQWLTVAETSRQLKLHRNTIYRHLRDGTFPCQAKRFGKAWRIYAPDVTQLLEALEFLIAEARRDGDS
jgi:excisionase family DNA binding protein